MYAQATDGECCFDLSVQCQQIGCGDPLQDALNVALWTLAGRSDCGLQSGWWGNPDLGNEAVGFADLNASQLDARLRPAIERAMEPLKACGIIDSVEVSAVASGRDRIQISVVIYGPRNCRFVTAGQRSGFEWVWDGFTDRA